MPGPSGFDEAGFIVMSNYGDFGDSIVRIIRKSDGFWVGMGFVLPGDDGTPGNIMTCAHVVADALGDRELAFDSIPPQGRFAIDFPNISVDRRHDVEVIPEHGWHPMRRQLDPSISVKDIAILQLAPGETFPDTAKISIFARVPPPPGSAVRAFGSPTGYIKAKDDLGHYSEGRYQGPNRGLYEFKSLDDADKTFIKPGCSGGCLWSDKADAGVGMVSLAYEDTPLAYATPFSRARTCLAPHKRHGGWSGCD